MWTEFILAGMDKQVLLAPWSQLNQSPFPSAHACVWMFQTTE